MGLSVNIIVIIIIVIILLTIVATTLFWQKRTNFVPIQQIFRVNTALVGSNRVYTIDNNVQPTITLKNGLAYRFILEDHNYPFYFGTSNVGGPGTPGTLFPTISPIDGAINIQIGDYLPKEFYYQSSITQNMGGKIVIV